MRVVEITLGMFNYENKGQWDDRNSSTYQS
jgi:hypothetical protein